MGFGRLTGEFTADSLGTGVADFGVSRSVDLIPRGSEIAVTNDNRMQYIVLVSNYRLNVQIAPQCRAFYSGLFEIINPRWLRMFNQSELAILVGESLFTCFRTFPRFKLTPFPAC